MNRDQCQKMCDALNEGGITPDKDLWNQPLGAFKRKGRDESARGYASRPGSGPAGESCKTCKHLCRISYAKTYLKCGLVRHAWTSGPKTDVRAKSPACQLWEGNAEVKHGRTAPRCLTIKPSNHMETPTHTATPVDLDRLVLHLHAGQTVAECPHCKGALTKETPILKGDEPQEWRDGSGALTIMRMALDPRPKCPHCYGRFELVIHLQNA